MASLKHRLLLIGPSNVGDAILIAPSVAMLRGYFPDSHLTVVVGERARAVFAGDPRIQTLVVADAYHSAAGRLRLAWSLWRYQPQVVVDLRSTVFPLLLKPWRFWRYLRQPPLNITHMRDRHLWKLKVQVPQLRLQETSAKPALWISAQDRAHVEQLRRRWGVHSGQPLVVVCAGARSHIKRWTGEGFAQVAQRLISEHGVAVVFCGEPEEKPVIEDVLGRMSRRAHTAVGLTTISQMAALMQAAQLVIVNDSASLHAASDVGAPTVAIFGPTDAQSYGPTAVRRRLIRRSLFCAPCRQALCRFSHECMRFITADEVYAAAVRLLGASTHA